MKISYDKEADAMYIYWNENPVDNTIEVSNRIKVDLDQEGSLRGIEILFVRQALKNTDFLNLDFQLPRVGKVTFSLSEPQEVS